MIDVVRFFVRLKPGLRKDLIAAHMTVSLPDFVRRAIVNSFTYALLLGFVIFMFLAQAKYPTIFVVAIVPLIFFFMMNTQLRIPQMKVAKRGVEIDNEVLFAGRFLLIKLGAGKPLFNALIETSQSYGVASKYFKEIVDDINFGTPIEIALNNAMDLSPSKYFKKILFQINNALKVGIDVTRNLEIVLHEIEEEQELEIEKYAKKMSTVALFYMLLAIVLPSLGMTLFVVVVSMLGIAVNWLMYGIILFVLVLIQCAFILLFRAIRPSVNI